MDKKTLDKANELQKRIEEVSDFIYTYEKTWKRGFLKTKSQLTVGHRGYGYYNEEEIDCDKELSEMIHKTLLEYQSKIEKEFKDLGVCKNE